jgi:hypothetical protein
LTIDFALGSPHIETITGCGFVQASVAESSVALPPEDRGDYGIYRLSVDNNIFGRPEVVDCDSDQEVIARAKARLDGLDVEVWDGPRIVIRLKSTDK